MRRIIELMLLSALVAVCVEPLFGGTDPIFGRTTVTPPATGSAAAADPAYSSSGLAATSIYPANPNASYLTPAATTASSSAFGSMVPAVARAPEVATPPKETTAVVPYSNSSVPLNIAPAVATPMQPVTVRSNTTYTPSGNPYVAPGGIAGQPSSSGWFASSSGSSRSSSASAGPGPKMTRTRVTPMPFGDMRNSQTSSVATPIAASQIPAGANNVADNRARTFGQLGQVVVDRDASAFGVTAASSAATANPTPGRATSNTFSNPRSGSVSGSTPRRIHPGSNVIDIMDLPPKDSGGSRSGNRSRDRYFGASNNARRDAAVRQASAVADDVSGSVQSANPYPKRMPESHKPVSFSPPNRYDHATDYSWLKGRLEYSQARRRWKLRYIAIDGKADRFGGSVVLPDTSLLSGYERGDYIEVKGRLVDTAKTSTAGDYAPDYEVVQIKRLDR